MNVLTKKMLRGIYRTRGQALAVIMVVLSGTTCYICLASAYRNLLLTRDTYYENYRFADFEIMLERVPMTTLFKLESLPGVRQIRGRIVEEVTLDVPNVEESRTGRLISMPDRREKVLNDVVVVSGRYFEEGAANEVILSDRFAVENGLALGDSIDMSLDGKKYTLRIVGFGLSPEYVYMIRSVQEFVPSPERFGILWVSQDFAEMAKNMKESCNSIIGTVDDREDLDEFLDKAEDILESYGVFAKVKRHDQLSNRFLSDEIKGLGVMAKVVPAVFLGVAGLIIMVLLNRMVRNERTQIGLLKAYGYSSLAVALHYLQYALILAIAGCTGAFFVGQWLAGGMIKMYVEFFQFPVLLSRVYPDVLARAMGIAIFFSLAGATLAAWRAARISPAESMRPESPRSGRRIALERIALVWRRMSFTWKMIARNTARNRFRTSLNAFGVMVSSALIIVGFFSLDAFNYLLRFQYEQTQLEDMKISFMGERGKEALYEVSRLDHVQKAEPVLQYPFEMRVGWRKKETVVLGLPRHSELQRLYDVDEKPIDIGEEGLVLAERIAHDLGVTVGSQVLLKPMMGKVTKEKSVRVSQVVKQYFGSLNYMNIDALSRVLDESFAMNAALLRTDEGTEHELSRALKDVPAVSSVEIKADSLKNLQDTIAQSMTMMGVMVIFFAGVIAFSVIYNVTTVSLAERQRELASLRVMGFSKGEVGRIMYYENFVTGALGLVLGIPFGLSICWALVHAYDNELYRMPFYVEGRTFVISTVLSIVFIGIANLAVRGKIQRLDLVEVLKERE